MKDSPEQQPLKCLIVDDEQIAIKGIANHISKLDFLTVNATCSSALEARGILENQSIDLMFLDINMPYLSGIDFLKSLDEAPLTILTTAYSEYALEGYQLNVVDYLLKPISFQRFFQAVTKAAHIFRTQLLLQNNGIEETPREMYIRQGDAFTQISWKDILYVEGMQNYLKLHFKSKTLIIHQTMTSLEEILPQSAFFRIHKSFLVNLSHIDSIAKGRVFINGKELPVSALRREELLQTVVYKNLISK
jgi:DNA-binding LytR/AlgR family response regulator